LLKITFLNPQLSDINTRQEENEQEKGATANCKNNPDKGHTKEEA